MSDTINNHSVSNGHEAYARLNEATIFAEAFNDLLSPEETSSFFLNVAHHFLAYKAGMVFSAPPLNDPAHADDPVREEPAEPILAGRGIDISTEEDLLAAAPSAQMLDELRRKVRPIEVAAGKRRCVVVPLVFGGDLLAYAVLLLDDVEYGDKDADIVRILGRSAGSALGRIMQARTIEHERDNARAVFASVASALINVDLLGRVREANPSARMLLGENIVGIDYKTLFSFTGRDPIKDCLDTSLPQHHIDAPATGGRIWGVTASPLSLEHSISGTIVGFRDITSLK